MQVKVIRYILVLYFTASLAIADICLPKLISDGMILQRDMSLKLWGWADPGESVNIKIAGNDYSCTADSSCRWLVVTDAIPAGGPYDITISGNNTIVVSNVMFGDVWVCSGQSNMELSMQRLKDTYPEIIANAENDNIRQFYVPREYNFKQPAEDVSSGSWVSASPETVLNFTAVGYLFARELNLKYEVPIGIINSSLGGSPAEAWLSEEPLKRYPHYYEIARRYSDDAFIQKIQDDRRDLVRNWHSSIDCNDAGLQKGNEWYSFDLDDSDWDEIDIPGYWTDGSLGYSAGVVWFRKEIDLPDIMADKAGRLTLGRLVDSDQAYINGQFVGTTSYQYPPRKYDFEAGLLRPGRNVICVRLINEAGRSGFVPEKEYDLTVDGLSVSLSGRWKYKLGAKTSSLPPEDFIRFKPLGLYNAMIAPLTNYAIKGAIWYQGESNVGRAKEYETLFPDVITDWRDKWQQGDFPFLFVQLASYLPAQKDPGQSGWAEIRQAQLKTLSLPNTAMAVATDIGEWNDIHPLDKLDVGRRLALGAIKVAYGEDIVYSGPIFKSLVQDGNKLILSFDNIGGGLIAKGSDNELKHYAIAGHDGIFLWAKAEIVADKVVVSNDSIPAPKYVRYAWADNPEGANLFNLEDLPASPFEATVMGDHSQKK